MIMPKGHKYGNYFTDRCNFDHVHKNLQFITTTSVAEVGQVCRGARLMVASGKFTESGYSGLEFLMNKIPTFVSEESDVASIMRNVSAAIADNFIFNTTQGTTRKQQEVVMQKWETKLISVLSDVSGLRHITELMLTKIVNSDRFRSGNMRLQDALHYRNAAGNITKLQIKYLYIICL